MSMQKNFTLMVILISLTCGKKSNITTSKKDNKSYETTKYSIELQQNFTSWVDNLRLRKDPSMDSEVIATLNANEELFYLKESSKEYLNLKLGNISTHGAWQKVKTKDGKIGWVYGGALSYLIYNNDYKMFANKDDFYIYSVSNNKLLFHDKIDTGIYGYIYGITCNDVGKFLVIKLTPNDNDSFYIGIYDKEKNTIVEKIKNYQFYLGSSPDNKYLLFDNGTSAYGRPIMIYSIDKKEKIYEESPFLYDSSQWKNNGILKIQISLGKKVKGLPDLDQNRIYTKVFIWEKGTIKKTDTIIEGRTE